ncbi:MAG: aspartate carbamoyltransferase catalytic subunit [Parvularculaceae bacterium]
MKRPAPPGGGFPRKSLLGVDDLSLEEVRYILALAEFYATLLRSNRPAKARLAGKTQVNLFFEDSTRTNSSFELAGKKLGADVLTVPVTASSVNKGESLFDTAGTLAAMGADVMIVRHREPGVHRTLAEQLSCPVVNAGDGAHEHPTQALLDAATIRSVFGGFDGLIIAICGDVRHSRVARSGTRLFTKLGAEVRFVGPQSLMPDESRFPDIARYDTLQEGLAGAHIVMALRMQFERMEPEEEDPSADYFERFGLSHQTLRYAGPGAAVMHPGPMNRGVEIDDALADDAERSLILRQVFYGVATRMACLDAILTGGE